MHHLLGAAEDALAERLGHEGADLAGRAARHRREEAKLCLLLKVAVNPSNVQVKLVDEVVLRIEVVLVAFSCEQGRNELESKIRKLSGLDERATSSGAPGSVKYLRHAPS